MKKLKKFNKFVNESIFKKNNLEDELEKFIEDDINHKKDALDNLVKYAIAHNDWECRSKNNKFFRHNYKNDFNSSIPNLPLIFKIVKADRVDLAQKLINACDELGGEYTKNKMINQLISTNTGLNTPRQDELFFNPTYEYSKPLDHSKSEEMKNILINAGAEISDEMRKREKKIKIKLI
jgi:hypothetical protein